jgi:hypothetical protein
MEIGGQGFYQSKLYKTFSEGFPDSRQLRECWESHATGGKAFDLIIKKAIPDGITQAMARAIWNGDSQVQRSAQLILAKAKAPNQQSIDGMYVIDAKAGHITVMVLGTRAPLGPKNPSPKLTVKWNEEQPSHGASDFDLALCTVSHPLDYGFSP